MLKELIYFAPDKREVSKGESLKDTAASSGPVPHRTALGSIHQGQPTWTIPDPEIKQRQSQCPLSCSSPLGPSSREFWSTGVGDIQGQGLEGDISR